VTPPALATDASGDVAGTSTVIIQATNSEVISPAAELAAAFVASLAARPQTQETYRRACRRFVTWLGPDAGPEDLTLGAVSAYQRELHGREPALSPATVRKDRAAINSFVRFCVEQRLVPARQGELALAVRLPGRRGGEREAPKALSDDHYRRTVAEAKAAVVDDALRGQRDLAIVLVLGDAGLRCEELCRLERRDFLPARAGARRRRLDVRYGKGGRRRKVPLSDRAAIVRWDELREAQLGPADAKARLFMTLGRRRRDGSYVYPGGALTQDAVRDVVKQLSGRAGVPGERRHPHVLRHTFALRYLRVNPRPEALEELRRLLGHADLATTQVYLRLTEDDVDAGVDALEAGELQLAQARPLRAKTL
jgi:integrase/recombinase XerD